MFSDRPRKCPSHREGRTFFTRSGSTPVKGALELLAGAVVKVQTKKGKWSISSMLAGAVGDDKGATVAVTVNPYFAEMYAAGSVNLLDLAKRAELSRPVSKALHRFDWRGHFLTLAAAINLDMEQPQKQIRRQIKQAMTELRKVGVLAARSKFAGDVVREALDAWEENVV